MGTTTFLSLLVLLPSLGVGAATVQAHSRLDHADPAMESSVSPPPNHVTLRFTERLEPKFSRIEVRSRTGDRMDLGNVNVDGTTMQVKLKVLPAGTYTVLWRVLSVDTHSTKGSYKFHVVGK